jgi:hypothetical protein
MRKPPTPRPTIHEAERITGPEGIVEWGVEIDPTAAIERRKQGFDIVVLGASQKVTKGLAREIEAGVGPPSDPEPPHARAGKYALPHFHQESRDPAGHSFFETAGRKARKKK